MRASRGKGGVRLAQPWDQKRSAPNFRRRQHRVVPLMLLPRLTADFQVSLPRLIGGEPWLFSLSGSHRVLDHHASGVQVRAYVVGKAEGCGVKHFLRVWLVVRACTLLTGKPRDAVLLPMHRPLGFLPRCAL